MRPDESEEIVDRALKALPTPRAPRTLLPRVMAAVDAQAAKSAPRPWVAWPLGWQIASVAFVLVVALGVARLWPSAQAAGVRSVAPIVASVTAEFGELMNRTSVAMTLARATWYLILQPLSGYALVLVLVMGAACATFGAALNRVALGGHT